MKHSWFKYRFNWLDEKGAPQKPDWNTSGQAEEMADLQEQDYCYKEMQDCEEYIHKMGGQKIKIPVFNVDADGQSIFSDEDALLSLHPKLRRQIAAATVGKGDAKSLAARAAQKAVEKRKLSEVVAHMQDDWHTYLSESLLFKSWKQLAQELVPE